MRGSGGVSRENAGISNEKAGEIPARRKPKVSRVKAICPGSVGPYGEDESRSRWEIGL